MIYFEKVVEINPQNADALINIGYLLKKNHKNDKALEYIQKAS